MRDVSRFPTGLQAIRSLHQAAHRSHPLTLLALLSTLPTLLLAQPISGTLTGNNTWSGTVAIAGDVRIPAGASLTIQAGTLIQVAARADATAGGADASRSELIVDGGVLQVQGTDTQPVRFTSNATPQTPGDWVGLAILDGDVSLEHFIVEYAVDGLWIRDHDLRFNTATYRHATLQHNAGRGLRLEPAAQTTAHQLVLDAFQLLLNEEQGALLSGSGDLEVVLRNSVLQQNGNTPRGRFSGLYNASFVLRLENCQIRGNGLHGLESYYQSITLQGSTVENNYGWGAYAWINQADLRQNTFRANGAVDRGGGLYVFGWNTPRSLAISGNSFTDHPSVALHLDDGGAAFLQTDPISGNVFARNQLALWARVNRPQDSLRLSGNDFLDNNRSAETGGPGALRANANHWGPATTAELQQSRVNLTQITDSRDNSSFGQVWIGTWQTEPLVGGSGGSSESILYTTPDVTLQAAGEIATAQSWSGKILLTGDVRIVPGGTLTIQPGTLIVADFLRDSTVGGEDASRCELTVAGGQLLIQGQPDQPVTFTSAAASGAQRPGDWRGLLVLDGDLSLEHFVVEYAVEGLWIRDHDLRFNTATYRHATLQQNSGRGLRIDPAAQTAAHELVLEGFQIRLNEEQGAFLSGSGGLSLVLRNSVIQQNGDTPRGRFSGLYNASFALRLENCQVRANGNHGIESYYQALTLQGCTVEANYAWGLYAWIDQATLRQNTFQANGDVNRDGGAYLFGWNSPRTLDISGNTFSDNPATALRLEDGGAAFHQPVPISGNVFARNQLALLARVSKPSDSLRLSGNDFLDNTEIVHAGGPGALHANGNYWGPGTTTELQQSRTNLSQITDSRDLPTQGQVWIGTWRTEPIVGGSGGSSESIVYTTPDVTLQAAGDIANAQTWSGKVLLTGDVRILGGGSLTIQPGTLIVADFLRDSRVGGEDASRCELTVNGGQLLIQGQPDQPVILTSAAASGAQRPGDWRGLLVLDGDVALEHFVVEYAVEGLWIRDHDLRFNTATYHHATLQHNSGRGLRIDPSPQTAVHPLVLDTFVIRLNEEYGALFSGSGGLEITLRNSTIQQNGDTPRGRFSGLYNASFALHLENCQVRANGNHGIESYYQSLTLQGCTIEANYAWGAYAWISQANLRQNTVRANGDVDRGGGLYLMGWNTPRTLAISGNSFTDHPSVALQLDDGGAPFQLADPISNNTFARNQLALWIRATAAPNPLSLSNNDFLENQFVIRNLGAGAALANDNHWGEPTTTELNQGAPNLSRIFDAQDSPSAGAVTIQQWSQVPLLQGGQPPTLSSALLYCVFLEGTIGRSYQIQSAPSPEGPWTPVATLQLQTSPTVWVDTASDRTQQRFYQAVLLP